MGASLALAGATACTRQPDELIVPYVPAARRTSCPGRPLFFATAMPLGGVGHRPAGREPRGTADQDRGQSRSPVEPRRDRRLRAGDGADAVRPGSRAVHQVPRRDPSLGHASSSRCGIALGERRRRPAPGSVPDRPIGIAHAGGQLKEVLAALPQAKLHAVRARQRATACARARALAFGEPSTPHYRLDQADVIVSLDADLFGAGTAGNVRYARDFANGRRVRKAKAEMNRLYVAEPTPTPTGSIADHRLPLQGQPDERGRARADRSRRPGRRGAGARRRGRSTSSSRRRCQGSARGEGQERGGGRRSAACRRPRRRRTRSTRRSATSGTTVVLHRAARRGRRSPTGSLARARRRT